jgi:hypothetical protein
VLAASAFGAERQHIRVTLATGEGIVEATAFNKPALAERLADYLPRGRIVDACFGLELDSFQGFVRVRARLRDLRPARETTLAGRPVAAVTSAAAG